VPNEENIHTKIKIVDAVFAFKNSEVLALLTKRGEHLIDANQDKVKEVETEIDRLIEKRGDDIWEPVKAYITFADEEGYLRAVNLVSKVEFCMTRADLTLYGEPLYFKPAPEPSNILWESQYVAPLTKYFRSFVTYSIILLILVSQVALIFEI
jgi:hypothetical protein